MERKADRGVTEGWIRQKVYEGSRVDVVARKLTPTPGSVSVSGL